MSEILISVGNQSISLPEPTDDLSARLFHILLRSLAQIIANNNTVNESLGTLFGDIVISGGVVSDNADTSGAWTCTACQYFHNGVAYTAPAIVTSAVAELTTDLTGANNDMVFTAVERGLAGNDISVAYVVPAADATDEVVEVITTGAAKLIQVTLRKSGATLSTAAQVKTAIEGDTAANALVTIANSGGDTGAGEVIAMDATPLEGGLGDGDHIAEDGDSAYVDPVTNTIKNGTAGTPVGGIELATLAVAVGTVTPTGARTMLDPTKVYKVA